MRLLLGKWATERQRLLSDYYQRVTADGGQILLTPAEMEALRPAGDWSWFYVPSGRKAGTSYAQIPGSAGDLTMTRASVANEFNRAGVLSQVAANVGRLDFLNGVFQGQPIEPAATNLFTWSRDFSNAAWIKNNLIATTQSSDSIYADAYGSWTVIPDSTNTVHSFQRVTPTSATGVSQYFILKRLGTQTRYVSIALRAGSSSFRRETFDLQTGTRIAGSGIGSRIGTITQLGNGYFLIDCTSQGLNWGSGATNLYLSDVVPSFNTVGAQTNTFVGNGTDGILFAHGQSVAGNVNASSPILTHASTATRNADVISLTGASALIGQTQGTIYAEVNISNSKTATSQPISLWSAAVNRLQFFINSSNQLNFQAVLTGSVVLQISTTVQPIVGMNKIAVGYQSGNTSLYLNGALIGSSSSSFSVPPCDSINLGSSAGGANQLNDRIRAAGISQRRWTNAELENLTRL